MNETATGRNALRHGHLAQQRVAVAVQLGGRIGHVGEGLEQRALRLIDLIEHMLMCNPRVALQYNAAGPKLHGVPPLKNAHPATRWRGRRRAGDSLDVAAAGSALQVGAVGIMAP
jgi:hypothetical protein